MSDVTDECVSDLWTPAALLFLLYRNIFKLLRRFNHQLFPAGFTRPALHDYTASDIKHSAPHVPRSDPLSKTHSHTLDTSLTSRSD